MTDLTISLEAQFREAVNQLSYFRERTAALAQHIIDRDQAKEAFERSWNEREIDLKAQIAGLQDELRQARSQITHTGTALVALQENANGE